MDSKELAKNPIVKKLYGDLIEAVDKSDLPMSCASSRAWSARSAVRDFARYLMELFDDMLGTDSEEESDGSDTVDSPTSEESESISEEHESSETEEEDE